MVEVSRSAMTNQRADEVVDGLGVPLRSLLEPLPLTRDGLEFFVSGLQLGVERPERRARRAFEQRD